MGTCVILRPQPISYIDKIKVEEMIRSTGQTSNRRGPSRAVGWQDGSADINQGLRSVNITPRRKQCPWPIKARFPPIADMT